jgi:hypothetical protein
MYFKVADTSSNELRYYPYVEKTTGNETTPIGNVTPGANVTAPVGNVTPGVNVTAPEGNVTPGPGITPAEGQTVAEGVTPGANATTPEGGIPGFTGVWFGIAGLLAVIYLVRRNN